jgi:hypothetical protein
VSSLFSKFGSRSLLLSSLALVSSNLLFELVSAGSISFRCTNQGNKAQDQQ